MRDIKVFVLSLLVLGLISFGFSAYAGGGNEGIPIDDKPAVKEKCGGNCNLYKSDVKDTRVIEYVQIKLVEHGTKTSIKKTKIKVKAKAKKKDVEKDIKKANKAIDKLNKKQPAGKKYPNWPNYAAVKKIVDDAKAYVASLVKAKSAFASTPSRCFKELCDCVGDGKWKEFKPAKKPFQNPSVYIVYYVNDGTLRYEVKIKITFPEANRKSIQVQEGSCKKKGQVG